MVENLNLHHRFEDNRALDKYVVFHKLSVSFCDRLLFS